MGEFATAVNYFVCGCTCTFFFCLSLLYYHRRREHRFYTIASVILMYWCLLLLKDPAYSLLYDGQHDRLLYTLQLIDTSAFFTCTAFVVELLSPLHLSLRKILVESSVYFAAVILYAFTGFEWAFNLTLVLIAVFIIYSSVKIAILMRRYRYLVRNNFSNESMHWMWRSVGLFSFLFIAWAVLCMRPSLWYDTIYYILTIIVWTLAIRYQYNRQQQIIAVARFSDEPETVQTETHIPNYSSEMKHLFEEEKIHRDCQLTLTDVARHIGTNNSYVSQYINSIERCNFCDFVNSYRIIEAEQLLITDRDASQEVIARAVGFNSLSTFRRAFFKKHHMTPNQYRKARSIN